MGKVGASMGSAAPLGGGEAVSLGQTEIARMWVAAQPTIAAYLSAVVFGRHDVDDILQEVAVICVEKFDQYDQQVPFVNWALGIARYEVLAFRRKKATDRHVFDDQTLSMITETCQEMQQDFSSFGDALNRCVKQLSDTARRILELRYARGMTPTEIATKHDRPVASVNMALYRIRNAIRKCMEDRSGVLDS